VWSIINLKNIYLDLRYGKKKLQRLRDRSLPYTGIKEMAKLSNVELIDRLKKVLDGRFKEFFKTALNTPSVKERIESVNESRQR